MADQPVCDACDAPIDRAHSYCLTTTSVVMSEAFWRSQFKCLTDMVRMCGGDERSQAAAFAGVIRRAAASDTPWLICENCSEFFVVDRAAARAHAARGTVPKGSGAVEAGGFALFAATAWEYVFGRWPTDVQQPTVGDTCDLCAKKIYRGEFAGRIPAEVTERYLAAGILDNPPLCPPRDGQGGWVSCTVCMARTVARADRAQGGR